MKSVFPKINYRYSYSVLFPAAGSMPRAMLKSANLSEDRLVARLFIDTIRTKEPEAAMPFLCGKLRNSKVLDLSELKEFFSEDSEYKILNSVKKSDIDVKYRKSSVMVADKNRSTSASPPLAGFSIVHIYMLRENDGNWRVFGVERE